MSDTYLAFPAARTFRVQGGHLVPLSDYYPQSWNTPTAAAECAVAEVHENCASGFCEFAANSPNTCYYDVPHPHGAPATDCTCGIASLRSVQEVARQMPTQARKLLAVVEPYGRVVAGPRGNRSQFGTLLALWVTAEWWGERTALENRYPTVTFHDTLAGLLAAWPQVDDGTGVEGVRDTIAARSAPHVFLGDVR